MRAEKLSNDQPVGEQTPVARFSFYFKKNWVG
jgi:hypothetical protein